MVRICPPPSSQEKFLLFLLLAVYAAASLVSLPWYQVFIDEPGYTDPAASLLLGQGFTSGAWYAQGYESAWAGNVPLHQGLLYLWMQVFGFSVSSVRSLNILFVLIGMTAIWAGAYRLGILNHQKFRLAAMGLILASHAGAVWVNLGRPDAICVAIAGLIFLSFSVSSRSIRLCLLSLLAAASPWAGIPLAVVVGFCGVILLVWKRTKLAFEVAAMALGGAAGVASLVVFYESQGVFSIFLESILPHSNLIDSKRDIIPPPVSGLKHRLGALTDYTLLCLAGSTAFAWLSSWRNRESWPWIVGGAISTLGVSLLLAITGVFPLYYAWFAFIPGTISLIALWDRGLLQGRLYQAASLACLVALLIVGLPRVWINGFVHRGDDLHGRTERFISTVLRADDVVLTQPQAWYAAKHKAKRVYHGFRAPNITPEEAKEINVVVSSPPFFKAQSEILTGEWHKTDELVLPNRNTHRLPFSKWYRDNPTVQLTVYRRISH